MAMNNRGAALIVTMVYLIIVSIICAAVLAFSSGHYQLISQRVDKFQNMYYSEGGLYLGLYQGTGSGTVTIDTSNPATTVTVNGTLTSTRIY